MPLLANHLHLPGSNSLGVKRYAKARCGRQFIGMVWDTDGTLYDLAIRNHWLEHSDMYANELMNQRD